MGRGRGGSRFTTAAVGLDSAGYVDDATLRKNVRKVATMPLDANNYVLDETLQRNAWNGGGGGSGMRLALDTDHYILDETLEWSTDNTYASSKNGSENASATEYDAVGAAEYADASFQQGGGSGPLPSHDYYSGYDISEPNPAFVYAEPMSEA